MPCCTYRRNSSSSPSACRQPSPRRRTRIGSHVSRLMRRVSHAPLPCTARSYDGSLSDCCSQWGHDYRPDYAYEYDNAAVALLICKRATCQETSYPSEPVSKLSNHGVDGNVWYVIAIVLYITWAFSFWVGKSQTTRRPRTSRGFSACVRIRWSSGNPSTGRICSTRSPFAAPIAGVC